VKLGELKIQALRHLALSEPERALQIYHTLLLRTPADLEARMRVADVLVHAGHKELACRVYAAVLWGDIQAGRPLHALVCGQALADLGQPLATLHDSLAALYGAASSRLLPGAQRWPAPDPEEMVPAETLALLAAPSDAEMAVRCAEVAADTATFPPFPQHFAPVPLLSELPAASFCRLTRAALVRRLPPRVAFIEAGQPAHALFFVASGAVELWQGARDQDPGLSRTVHLRLSEGGLCGELALLSAPHARLMSAETTEPSDLIELPVRALRAVSQEDPEVAGALSRLLRERLARLLLRVSPLFQPLSTGQRLELLRRFTTQQAGEEERLIREGEVPDGLYVLLQGALEIVKGNEPFETVERRLAPGDVIGEGALLRPAPAPATVRVPPGETAEVARLSRAPFDKLVGAIPRVQKHYDQLPHETLRELHEVARSLLHRALDPPRAHLAGDPAEEDLRAEFPLFV
jgi:CRP-like cAMP-binding protein